MAGETDLAALLAGMAPVLDPRPHGFALVAGPSDVPPGLTVFALINEDEGMTIVAPADALAAAGIAPGLPFARITLSIHSALEAVGLTAAVARALADEGISANVVAAFHHDHVFVGWDARERALAALRRLSGSGAEGM